MTNHPQEDNPSSLDFLDKNIGLIQQLTYEQHSRVLEVIAASNPAERSILSYYKYVDSKLQVYCRDMQKFIPWDEAVIVQKNKVKSCPGCLKILLTYMTSLINISA